MKDRNLFVARLSCRFPQSYQVIHTSASLTFQELEVNQFVNVCQTFWLFYPRPQQVSARHALISSSNHRNRCYLASISLQEKNPTALLEKLHSRPRGCENAANRPRQYATNSSAGDRRLSTIKTSHAVKRTSLVR